MRSATAPAWPAALAGRWSAWAGGRATAQRPRALSDPYPIPIEPASVYTLELGTHTERGDITLEDDVLVTEDSADYLTLERPVRADLR